jgi:Ca-activated chloride channel family protein
MMEEFHFLRPEWLLLIPVLLILLVYVSKRPGQSSGWEKVCDPDLLNYLSTSKHDEQPSSRLLHWALPLLIISTSVALAGPSWEKKEQPIFQQANALVIIIDLSLSMQAEDIKPSRLERAKLKIIDILEQKQEGQTALIAYAGDAHVVSPLTIDTKTILSLLPALDTSIMPIGGSYILDSLKTARELLINSGFSKGDILLLTDGVDQNVSNELKQMVVNLQQDGYALSIIGIGSNAGSPIPIPGQGGFVKDNAGQVILSKLTEKPLIQLAELGGGEYHKLSLTDNDFQFLFNKSRFGNEDLTQPEQQLEQWVDAGAYITLLIIPLALLIFRKGLMSILAVILLSTLYLPEPAYALEWDTDALKQTWNNLWLTPDQQGQEAFKQQHFKEAADKFEHAHWKAGAHYRAGDYEKATEYFSQDEADPVSIYNKGNSLAHQKKFNEAIDAYNQAIDLDSDFQDAIANRDYLKSLLAQQQAQNQQQKAPNQKNNESRSSESKQEQNKQQQGSEQEQQEQEGSEQEQQEQEGSEQEQQEQEGSEQEQQESSDGEQEKQDNSEQNEGASEEQSQKSAGEEQQGNEDDGSKQEEQTGTNGNEQDEQTENEAKGSEQEEQNLTESGEQEQQDETEGASGDELKEQEQENKSEANKMNQPQYEESQEPAEAQPINQSIPQQAESDDENYNEQQQNEESSQEQAAEARPSENDVLSQLSQEEQQSLKQWLQRIPDNPGELLRIKFRNNSLLKQQQNQAPSKYKGNPW